MTNTSKLDESLWFRKVPAYRIAVFRVAIAIITMFYFIPQFSDYVHTYQFNAFHIPMIPGMLTFHPIVNFALILILWLVAWTLLFGFYPRLSAAVLATIGVYIFLIDCRHYNHNLQFHFIILCILSFAKDGVSIRKLYRGDEAEITCEVWPELLISYQVAIVFFYAAIEKVFSPFWGSSGTFFILHRDHPLDWIQTLAPNLLATFVGPISVLTIIVEFFVSIAFLFRFRQPFVLFLMFLFFVATELLTRAGVFAWDLIASLILFFPAADRAYLVSYNPECRWCSLIQHWISKLDWLRRIRWIPTTQVLKNKCTPVVSSNGETLRDYKAIKKIVQLLPGPIFIIFLLLRLGNTSAGFFRGGVAICFEILIAFFIFLAFIPGLFDPFGKFIYAIISHKYKDEELRTISEKK